MASSSSASTIPTRHPETEVAVPSASTYAPALPDYQIFINHRGSDVKKTLASNLYYLLVHHRFKVFLDKREMKGGENIAFQIEDAIKNASVHIAIFSPRYGESRWCLNELVLMRETRRTIIPVFYKVKPCDLRCIKGGLYAKALEDLAKKTDGGKPRYDSETIENWKNALLHVAEISGFELEAFNGDEGELIDKVAKRVRELIVPVPEYPYGVDKKVEDFEDFEKTGLLPQKQSGKLPSEIESTLKISYDGLNPEEKEILLDIVSFFIGEKRDMAIKIWDGSGWNGSLAFQSLQDKSLVEVDSENKIKILHNYLRDMGREATSGSGRRLWRCTEHIDDLLQQLYNDQVRGLRRDRNLVSTKEPEVGTACYHVFGHEIKPSVKLRNKQQNTKLRLLDVEGDDLAVILEKLHPINLLWLRWRNCSYSFLPDWVPMHNIRVLEVDSSILKNLWKGKSQAPLELRELVITSPLSKLPNSIGDLKYLELMELHCSEIKSLPDSFGYLARLEHIDLSGSKKLEKLPVSFDRLLSLKFINLRDCSEIKSLPDSMGKLTNLEHIDLSGSKKLEKLPVSFDRLLSLKVIKLRDCSEIKSLPDSMGKLTNLEHIDLSFSKNLERLPKTFGQLTSLKYLDLRRCNYLTIDSNTLGDIRKLEYIDLSDCEKIESLPPQVAHQQSLEKLCGPFLQIVPSPRYRNLKELKLWKGSKSKKLEDLSIPNKFLTQLAKLEVNECVFPERSFPKNEAETGESTLKHVQLQHMELCKTEISEVSFADGFCPNLRQLLINSCDRLEKVGTLPDALETLELTRCKELKKIEGLCGLAKLQKLKIKACRKLEELSSIETLKSLERLEVSECGKLKRIERLSQMTKLRRLDLSKCSELERLNISKCSELEELAVSECGKLKRIESLSQLTKLERLNLSKCSELEEVPGVEHLMSLKLLVKECPKLQRSSPENSSGQSST